MTGSYVYVTQVHVAPDNRADDVYIATTIDEARQQFQSYIDRRQEEFGEKHVVIRMVNAPETVDGDDYCIHGEFLLEIPTAGLQCHGETYSVYVGD